MSDAQIHRDSLAAWQALLSIGGLEPSGRDNDLVEQLKRRINPDAESLEQALVETSVAEFLAALLATIQPFAAMFRDILTFFEKANARFGQAQWRLSVGDEMVDLKQFEEFLESWSSIEFDIDVPALDLAHAFALNDVRRRSDNRDYLRGTPPKDRGPLVTGVLDVDEWLAAYHQGEYRPLPRSIAPETQPPGLDDAARVIMAALHVIGERGLGREEMLTQHRARKFRCDNADAFHPWTIAQSETDRWLESDVLYLANLLAEPAETRVEFGAALIRIYEGFGRRRFATKMDIRSIERILSLPAWKRRYEFYGVWVGTQIVDALSDHDVRINHEEGALRFAFAETRLADIDSARPQLSLYTERWSPLSNPVGKSRKAGAQPDYGIWTVDPSTPRCMLVVEVKHYKKESTGNFGASLVDYANAHPGATIVLVNYGPAEADYERLWGADKDRCIVLGNFNPNMPSVRQRFHDLVRNAVGEPVRYADPKVALTTSGAILLDVSGSMSSILDSDWFRQLIDAPEYENLDFLLVDNGLRATVTHAHLWQWFKTNELGPTSLQGPVAEALDRHGTVILITDADGAQTLSNFNGTFIELAGAPAEARFVRITRRHLV